jgi:hypothetical protein
VASANTPFHSLNAGQVSREALGRVDLAKMRITAEVQKNLLPTVLGPAKFRPGSAFVTRTLDDAEARLLPFVFNVDTKALIELTDGAMRILLDGEPLTRPSVTATVTNGSFATDLTGWTGADEAGATSDFSGGRLRMIGTGTNQAIRQQQVTVNEAGTEHALRVVVFRGPIIFKVGSTSGGDEYIAQSNLDAGEHSLGFTPAGDFHITVASESDIYAYVTSIEVEADGAVVLDTEWAAGVIPSIRYAQSGDVLFLACDGVPMQKIERRSQRSWSMVEHFPLDGPFRFANSTGITVEPDGVTGNITMTASRPLFEAGHEGALWRLTHFGQTAESTLGGADQYTQPVRVTGVDEGDRRRFYFTISGTFVATVTLQRSFGEPGNWEDVQSYTSGTSSSYEDDYDNSIVYYRLGIKAGDYTSGSADVSIEYAGSIQTGVVRITDFQSSTSVKAEVHKTLGRAEATADWAEGEWSIYRGFPSSNTFHDGRLWWGWEDRIYGSVSDAYSSFDAETEGDAAPIVRSIATGGFERIFWLLSNQRLLAGTGAQEISVRASSFDEPLTTSQFTARAASDRGSSDVQAAKVDARAIFAQRSRKRVFEMVFDAGAQDFGSRDLTRLDPDICAAGIRDITVQRQPDTRLWFTLDDGTCAVLTYEPSDEVVAWTPVETSEGSSIKGVTVLPGEEEDEVWLVVERPVSATTRHYVEKLARFDECVGGTLNKTMDSHLVYDGSSTTTISGLDHLIGQEVVAWGNGAPFPDLLTVNGSGEITLPSAVTDAVIGLPYEARFRSTKLAYAATAGTALLMKKRAIRLGLLMMNVCPEGIRIGRDFDNMTGLPAVYKGRTLTAGEVLEEYDQSLSSFSGAWDTDARICFSVSSPYPATFQGMVVAQETNEGFSMGKPE